MQDFQHGPFEFSTVGRPVTINSQQSQRWQMQYGHSVLAERTLPAQTSQGDILEAFADDRSDFIRSHQPLPERRDPAERTIVKLVRSTDITGVPGKLLGEFEQRAEIPDLTAGMLDDRFETWLITGSPMCAVPMTLDEFERLRVAHNAIAAAESRAAANVVPEPPRAWIAALLPGDILTSDPEQWRAPTNWEIRHLVGEGSFTGISGAKAAALVGVSPQNFRKYTARDGASTRQGMSYTIWHMLLHKLGVQMMGLAS